MFFENYIVLDNEINPYLDDFGNAEQASFYANDNGEIFLVNEFNNNRCIFDLKRSTYISDQNIIKNLHSAKRTEIKKAGIWDAVFNKWSYSSKEDQLETELEEYLRLGEAE